MFTIRQAAGKGLGVFASQPILAGQRILAERALLTLTAPDGSGSILRQAHALTQAGRDSLLSLSSNPSKSGVLSWAESLWQSRSAPGRTALNHAILNIFRNNNFDIGGSVRALFPGVARLNHSCVPNAQGNFNGNLGQFTVHATRDIAADEEVTISYLDEHLGLQEARMGSLKDGYGFDCGCPACDPKTSEAGEARRAEVARRLGEFAETASEDPRDEMEVMIELLEAYEAEGIRGREVATMYVAVARKAFGLGAEEQGRELAMKGLRLEEEAVGKDSPFYAATLKDVEEMGVEVGV
ncbi:TPR domain-containing protein [Colletotrichum musicola]|uniref:TPR domain-containing protein n=1 Tax=Colletotrichum musicola TaxID=2175873 RepID=A0A8H6J8B9_9PEZI|nr:TPR domain-containing protein [Colletotrichum musicola]